MTVNAPAGYEPPVRDSFLKQFGIDPRTLARDDSRWVKHQGEYFADFLRRVRRLLNEVEQKSGRKLDFTLEGQNGASALAPEPGWPRIPRWAKMLAYVDVELIASERLVDRIAFWQMAEIDRLREALRQRVKLATRYRWFGFPEGFSEEQCRTRRAEARRRGVSLFVVNEARYALMTQRWMCPTNPGLLYRLMAKSRKETRP